MEGQRTKVHKTLDYIIFVSHSCIQNAAYWWRQYLLTNDPRAAANALTYMAYPSRHSYGMIADLSIHVWRVQLRMIRSILTRNHQLALDCLNELNWMENKYWSLYTFLKTTKPPAPSIEIGPSPSQWERITWWLATHPREVEDFLISVGVMLIFGMLAKSIKFLTHPIVRQYLPQMIEYEWSQLKGPLLRRFPQLIRNLLPYLEQLRRIYNIRI